MRALILAGILIANGSAVAQELPDEQRIADLLGQLHSGEDAYARDEAFHELVRAGDSAAAAILQQVERGDVSREELHVLAELGASLTEADVEYLLTAVDEYPDDLLPSFWHAIYSVLPFLPRNTRGAYHLRLKLEFLRKDRDITSTSAKRQLREEAWRGNEIIGPTSRHVGLRAPMGTESSTHELITILTTHEEPYYMVYRNAFAARLLGLKGSSARDALPRLVHLMELPVWRQRVRFSGLEIQIGLRSRTLFALAILQISTAPDDVIRAHSYLVEHGDTYQQHESMRALRELGGSAVGATGALARTAGDPDVDTMLRYEAITTLGMIGPAAKDAVATLEKLTEHDDPQIAERAKAALRQVRGR